MENSVLLKKFKDKIVLVELGTHLFGGFSYNRKTSWLRKNSAMTKDLIKQEVMCRVLSFRPTMNCLVKNDFRGVFSCIYF